MSLFFLTFFLVWISQRLSGAVAHDLEDYTSIATRTFSIVNGYLIGLKYPLGVGGGIWQQVLSDSMMENLKIAEKMMPNLNFNEIIFYCQNFSRANTAKSALAQCCMYWGVVGTIYFLHSMKWFYNDLKKRNIVGKNVLLSILVVNLFSISFQTDFQYDMFLLLAIPFLLYKKV